MSDNKRFILLIVTLIVICTMAVSVTFIATGDKAEGLSVLGGGAAIGLAFLFIFGPMAVDD